MVINTRLKVTGVIFIVAALILLLSACSLGQDAYMAAPAYDRLADDEPDEPIEINKSRGIVWTVLPQLEHGRVYRNSFGHYTFDEAFQFYPTREINSATGQLTGEHMWGYPPLGHYTYDIERGLFGQPVYAEEYHFSFGMHPTDQFPEILYTWFEDISWFTNRQLFPVAGVDSSMRRYWGPNHLGIDHGWWLLTEDAFSGKYAIMDNNNGLQFVTDFVFDWIAADFLFDMIEVRVNDMYGYGIVDERGEFVIPAIFEHIVIIDENTAFAKYEGRYGILDIRQTAGNLR